MPLSIVAEIDAGEIGGHAGPRRTLVAQCSAAGIIDLIWHHVLAGSADVELPLVLVVESDDRQVQPRARRLIVPAYAEAVAFFVGTLQFDLIEGAASRTIDGRQKRWLVGRPPGAPTGLLLARADGDEQRDAVGVQHAGRVGFVVRVDDFDAAHGRMRASGIEFVTTPNDEPYGRFAVFVDIAGDRRDLLGPRPPPRSPTRQDPAWCDAMWTMQPRDGARTRWRCVGNC